MRLTSRAVAVFLAWALPASGASGGEIAENFEGAEGLIGSYSVFKGTPAEGTLTSPGTFWVGTLAGLEASTGNPFYNDPPMLSDGARVLAFGPSDLHHEITFTFGLPIASVEFALFDVESTGALRMTCRDAAGNVVWDDPTYGQTGQLVLPVEETFAHPVASMTLTAQNTDGLVIDEIQVTLATSGCNGADLAQPFGLLDLSDITAFASAFLGGDSIADLDGNSLFDLSDINQFVASFLEGCPVPGE